MVFLDLKSNACIESDKRLKASNETCFIRSFTYAVFLEELFMPIPYKNIRVTYIRNNSQAQMYVDVLVEKIEIKLDEITDNDIRDLISKYVFFLRNTPDYTKQTKDHIAEFKKTLPINSVGYADLSVIAGSLIQEAANYYSFLKNILEKKITNAVIKKDENGLKQLFGLLSDLKTDIENAYGNNTFQINKYISVYADPANIHNFLNQAANFISSKLEAFNQERIAVVLPRPGI